MKNVGIREAKANFSKLLRDVAAGEEITITKSGLPIARLIPIQQPRSRNFLGIERKRLRVPQDFDAPLPAHILASFWDGKAPRLVKATKK